MIKIGIIIGCLLLSFGCSKQDFRQDELRGGGAVLQGDSVVMHLATGFADMYTPSSTKAGMTDVGENLVRRIDVLIFKVTATDTVYYNSVRAGNIVISDNQVWFNATFKREVAGEKFKLILCANLADNAIQNASLEVGAKRDTTLARISYIPESGWALGQSFIPMWGEYDSAAELIEGTEPAAFGACKLLRAMAKVTIINNDPKFILEGGRVYGMPDKGRIAPADSCLQGTKVDKPTLTDAKGVANVGWMVATNQKVLNGLYVSESKAPKTSSEGMGVRVLVKGKYNGATESSYYRFDFVSGGEKPKMMDVLRNQVYNFTISELKHAGRPTEADAANMLPENGIGVVVWDNDTLNCLFSDGVYTVAMQDSIIIPYYTNETLDSCFKYSSDYPGEKLYASGKSWVKITTTKPSPVRFTWTENVSDKPRRCELYVNAGLRLRGVQKIYQKPAIYTVTPQVVSVVPYYATTNNRVSYTTTYVGKVKNLVANSWPDWVNTVVYDTARNVVSYSVVESFSAAKRTGTITVTVGHQDVKLPVEQAAAIYSASMPSFGDFDYRLLGGQTRAYTTDYLGARTSISSTSYYSASINPASKVISVGPTSRNVDASDHSGSVTVTIGRLTYTIPTSQPGAPYPICGGWQVTRVQNPNRYTWSGAYNECMNLGVDGHDDWRLPEHSELWHFWNNDRTVYGGGESLLSRVYWSATYLVDGTAWYFDFANGKVGTTNTADNNFIRCIRGARQAGWN